MENLLSWNEKCREQTQKVSGCAIRRLLALRQLHPTAQMMLRDVGKDAVSAFLPCLVAITEDPDASGG